MTELRNRGVKDILFVCTDGLSGFPEAIDAVFPQAVNQTCIVHLVRQSLRYLSWKERKSLRRASCGGSTPPPTPTPARQVLDELTAAWADSKTRTAALQVWERAWERFIPFLAFPDGDPPCCLHDKHRREPAHADPQDDQDPRPLPQRRRRPPADLARDHARQNQLAHLLQLDQAMASCASTSETASPTHQPPTPAGSTSARSTSRSSNARCSNPTTSPTSTRSSRRSSASAAATSRSQNRSSGSSPAATSTASSTPSTKAPRRPRPSGQHDPRLRQATKRQRTSDPATSPSTARTERRVFMKRTT